jgi:hypothetical protein
MLRKYLFLFIIFMICAIKLSIAQQTGPRKDSAKIYRNIENYSKKTRTTKFLYKFLFKSVAPAALPKDQHKAALKKTYKRFENKIIRNINVTTLDPFRKDLYDTTNKPIFIAGKILNDIHINSLPVTIKNLLVIRKNEPFDSVLVRESERLVRRQSYIREVYFYPVACGKNSDSVDIQIRVLDYWSIIPGMAASPRLLKLKLSDKNLAGLGQRFANSYTWNHTNGKNAFETSYSIPNFRNTYISSDLNYNKDEQNNYMAGISIDRPFYSAFARWAGGVYFSKQLKSDTVYENDTSHFLFPARFYIQDYWAAEAWQVRKGHSEDDRTTNLILSARFYRLHYIDKIMEMASSPYKHENESFLLAGLGLSTRKYVQDNFIFNFGKTEDVPIGRAYGIVGGYQIKGKRLFYLGANYSYGNYYPWGYLRTNLEYGTLFNSSVTQQGVVKAELNYSTKLFEIGDWNFRQFLKSSLTSGIRRLPNENLSINDGYGISGFNGSGLSGTHKFLFTLQTQSYAPGNILGFQFGPYLLASIGMLGNKATGFRNSRVYSQFGIGTLIRNKFLVISTFQLSFSFYPRIPGDGSNIIKINSFTTNDFGFLDFDIGKPGMVAFQ